MRKKRLYYRLIVGAALIVLVGVMLRPPPANGPLPQAPAVTPASTTLMTPTLDPALCQRPYESSSIWNVPIDWSVARIHPMSTAMMGAFFEHHSWIGSDAARYAPNIYFVSNDTPLVPVKLIKNRFRDAISDVQVEFGEPAEVVEMPLPAAALPAIGTDGQLVLVNIDTGEEWGLNKGYIDRTGNWFAGGIYRYSVENSGIPPEGFGQRGAGIGQLAGIVRRCEVERGQIDHAVTLAYDFPCTPEVCEANGWPASIPPFLKTDGRGTSPFDIPEGARLAIRPDVSAQEIEQTCAGVKGCILWATAMQDYGGFVVDNSDHPKTYAEGDATAHWDPSVWTHNMLRDIPKDWYVVIDWNSPATKAN